MRVLSASFLAASVMCGTAYGSTAVYKFVGAPLVTHSGCITGKDKITMTMIFKAPIKKATCSSSQPLQITIGDGVHSVTFKPAYYGSGHDFTLCKLNSGNKVDGWAVIGAPVAKSGAAVFVIDLENLSGSVADQIQDNLCSPPGSGSSGASGSWTGP